MVVTEGDQMYSSLRALLVPLLLLSAAPTLAVEGVAISPERGLPGKIDGLWTIGGNFSNLRISCLLDFKPPLGTPLLPSLAPVEPVRRRCQGVITRAVGLKWLRPGNVVFVVTDPTPAEESQPYAQEPWSRRSKLTAMRMLADRTEQDREKIAAALRDAEFIANNTVDTGKVFLGEEFPGSEPGGQNRGLTIKVVGHDVLEYVIGGARQQKLTLIRTNPN
jgi:hypothetical protein